MTAPYMRSLLGLTDPPRRRGVEGLLDQLQTSPFGEDDPDFDPNPLKKAKKPIPTRAAEVPPLSGTVMGDVLGSMIDLNLKTGGMGALPDATAVAGPRLPQQRTMRMAPNEMFAAPEPTLGHRIAKLGAEWLPPVDVPLAMEGGEQIMRGNYGRGAADVGLASLGALHIDDIRRTLKGAKAAGAVEDVASGAGKLGRAEFQMPQILGDSVAGRTIRGLAEQADDYGLPPRPGTAPIPEGHVRLYHQTPPEHIESIRASGLQLARARGIEGPRAIYADEKGFYGSPGDRPTVEFHVPAEQWSSPFVRAEEVPPSQFAGIHLPWHQHVRGMYDVRNEGTIDKVMAGEFDDLLSDSRYGPAIEHIKAREAAKAAGKKGPSALADTVAGKVLGKTLGKGFNREGGVPFVQQLADEYNMANPHYADLMGRTNKADPALGKEISDWYEKSPSTPKDPETIAAYRAFAKETQQQADFLKSKGVRFEYVDDNPYASSADMMRDVKENKRLKVFKTAQDFDHPLLSIEENDLFRAVHDFFGHAKEGNQFGPTGEENAYRIHSSMYSDLARKAMATETRGQNSWVNFGPFGEQNRKNPANTIYADQKTMLMPDDLRTRLLDSLPAAASKGLAAPALDKAKEWRWANIELSTPEDPRFKGVHALPREAALELQMGAAGAVTRPLAKVLGLNEGRDWSVEPSFGYWGGAGASGHTEPGIMTGFAPHVPAAQAEAISLAHSKTAKQAALFTMHPDQAGTSTGLHLIVRTADGTSVPANRIIELINKGRMGWDGATVVGPNLDQLMIGVSGLDRPALQAEIARMERALEKAGLTSDIAAAPVTTNLTFARDYDTALERTGVRGEDWVLAHSEANQSYESVANTAERLVSEYGAAEAARIAAARAAAGTGAVGPTKANERAAEITQALKALGMYRGKK